MGESGQRGDAASPVKSGLAAEAEPPGRSPDIASVIPRLFSDTPDARLRALEELEHCGERAAVLLVETLLKTLPQSGHYPVIAEALERIGKPVVPILLAGVNAIDQPRRADEVYLLEAIAEVLGHLADRRAVPALVRMLSLLQSVIRKPGDEFLASLCRAAKIRIHRALADVGSRDGADDLLDMIGDGKRRVREELVELSARVGDKRFLASLVRAHAKSLSTSEWYARHTRWAFREIARRERVERNDTVFGRLDAGEQALVDKLLPKAKNGHAKNGRQLRTA